MWIPDIWFPVRKPPAPAGGSSTELRKEGIEWYALWFAAVGVNVPILVKPKDRDEIEIDWKAMALERSGGSWKDVPPPGSAAELMIAHRCRRPRP